MTGSLSFDDGNGITPILQFNQRCLLISGRSPSYDFWRSPDQKAILLLRGRILKVFSMSQSNQKQSIPWQFARCSLAITLVLGSLISSPVDVTAQSPSPMLIAQTTEEDWAFANRMYEQRDIYNAFAILNGLLKRNPKFAPAHDLRGAILLEMGNPQGAYESITQAIKLDPNLASAYAHRGEVLANLGDPTSAIADFDKAIQLDSSLADAYYGRGNTQIELGNAQKAIADYTAALRYNPKLTSAYTNRGVSYMNAGDTDKAIADYSKALRQKPQITYPIYANRSEARVVQQKYQAALDDANQAIRENSQYAYGYVARGAALTGLEDYTGAEANFSRALQLDPNEGFAYYWRGLLRLKQGDARLAILDYEEALRRNSTIANDAYENYSLIARRESEPSQPTQPNSAPNVYKIANKTTVLIDGQNSGSGVIVSRNNDTYYLLTAKHVVATPDEYIIITSSGQEYVLDYRNVTLFANSDLAVIQFNSDENLAIAPLGKSELLGKGEAVFVSGWPAVDAAITKPSHLVTNGNIAGIRPDNGDGYELLYSNSTGPGMSGGPVFNRKGQVIGIHGRAAGNSNSGKIGINLGIPTHIFLQQASQAGLDLQKLGMQSTP